MAILDFSVSGKHGFGSVTEVCFEVSVSNFMCMSFVAVGRILMIVSYVAFKMASLWCWTMFNCNPPIAHCHPLLWGGGIPVDHWSTSPSFIKRFQINWVILTAKLKIQYNAIKPWWCHQMEIFSTVTGHLCVEFTGHRRIPLTKASNAEFWCFRWSAPE